MKKEEENLKILIESMVEKELNEGPFLDPISDIFKTTSYGMKKLGATLGTNFTKLTRQLFATLLPYVKYKELEKISNESSQKKRQIISNLDSQYRDVLQRNVNAFNNLDIAAASILLNPSLYFSQKAGLMGAVGILSILDILTTQIPSVNINVNTLKDRISNINRSSVGWQGQSHGSSGFGSGGMGDFGAGDGDMGMYQEQKIPLEYIQKEFENLLKNPNLINAVKSSNIVRTLDKVALDVIDSRIQNLNNVNSFEDFKKIMDKEEFDKIKTKAFELIKNNVKTKKNESELEKDVVEEMKNIYKKIYIDVLEKKRQDPMFSQTEYASGLIQKLK